MARAAAGGVDKGSGNQEGRRVVGLDVVGRSVLRVGCCVGSRVGNSEGVTVALRGVGAGVGDVLVGEGDLVGTGNVGTLVPPGGNGLLGT